MASRKPVILRKPQSGCPEGRGAQALEQIIGGPILLKYDDNVLEVGGLRGKERLGLTQFHAVAGTLAGYRTPDYEQGISVAGYHLHFINQERTKGGHALDFELTQGQIAISTSSELHLSLPRTQAFLDANMSLANVAEQIHQSEGG